VQLNIDNITRHFEGQYREQKIESTNYVDMITAVMLIEWVCSRRGMALSDVAVEENGLKL
jgi:hypothetical protein